jgi:hypothetical protein
MAKFPVGTSADIGDTVPTDYWKKVGTLLNTGVGSFYNVQNDDFGAKGDNSNDDTAEIQACIDASSPGDVIYFPPGTYLLSAPIVRKPFRAYVGAGGWSDATVLKAANGSSAGFQTAGGLTGVFVPESWNLNATVAAGPVVVKGIAVNGNRANVATGQHCGFILGHGEYWSHYEDLRSYENMKDGIRFTPVGKNGSTLMAAGISDVTLRDLMCVNNTLDGLRSVTSGGTHVTDVVISGDNLSFNNDQSGVYVDEAANWSGGEWHLWNNGKHGFVFANGSFASHVWGIIVEDFGRLGTSGDYLWGIRLGAFNGRSARLHDCTVTVNAPLTGVNHFGISIYGHDSDAHIWVHDNEIMTSGTVTASMFGFDFYSGDTGSQKLNLHEHSNVAYGFNAGQGKQYVGSGTFTYDPPRQMTGTASWTPGAIGANAGATTTVTVTGAALGDVVEMGYNQNLNAGLVLSGWVSSANTVTAQLRNVTGGSLTPTAGTVRAFARKF